MAQTSMTGYTGPQGMSTGRMLADQIPKGYRAGQLQQFTPEQLDLFKQMFSHVAPESYLSRLSGGDQDIFNQIEQPALQQFSGLQGNIASRFSGMGTGGRKSSGFQNAMTSASQDFAAQLASQRNTLQRQALLDLMGISSDLLGQHPYHQFLLPKQQNPSFLNKLIGGGAPFAGAGLGFLEGGPLGALAGLGIGSKFGQGYLGGF
jgi:hypothetical protein